jgi:hypothetical protein
MSGADEYVLDSDDEPLMGMSDWTPPRVPVQPMVSLRRMKRRTECGADLMAAAVGTLALPPFFLCWDDHIGPTDNICHTC